MIINDLHIVGVAFPPDEADSPLAVDANAMLPFPFALQSLKTVARRNGHVRQLPRKIQLLQLAKRDSLDRAKALHGLAREEPRRFGGSKGLDQL